MPFFLAPHSDNLRHYAGEIGIHDTCVQCSSGTFGHYDSDPELSHNLIPIDRNQNLLELCDRSKLRTHLPCHRIFPGVGGVLDTNPDARLKAAYQRTVSCPALTISS
jgi:ribulose-5-phosphate 4-epimerase/fuculose-1-phosphate aldolase